MAAAEPLIGILICAHLPDELQPLAGGDYDTVYRNFLQSGDPRVRTRAYDAINGELPASADECDAWVLTGSPHAAFEDTPWIVALRGFVVEAVAGDARIAGVCFGHQLVATALGGTVERADGFAVGPHTMHVEATEWFTGGQVTINAMHRDVVTRLPAGARTIAAGTTAEVPAFLVGDSVLCVQDHPEFGRGLTSALIESRRELIGDETARAGMERLSGMATNGDVVARWIVDFLLDRRR
jgi:GMP synthase-like glutamine amidotransferase